MQSSLQSKKEKEMCDLCNGDGFTTEHNTQKSHSGYDGSCLECPIQVQCEKCEGTGKNLSTLTTLNNKTEDEEDEKNCKHFGVGCLYSR